MLSKLAVRRLTKLADFMDALPREKGSRFHMSQYCSDIDHPCKSVMCAAGWASRVPSFKKAGYKLDDHGYPNYEDGGEQEFFDIHISQWDSLFSQLLRHTIKTPKQWAKHCRKFIKDNS